MGRTFETEGSTDHMIALHRDGRNTTVQIYRKDDGCFLHHFIRLFWQGQAAPAKTDNDEKLL